MKVIIQCMFIRRCHRKKDGKRHTYWALVESYRTARGPRQRVVAYLGLMDEAVRLGVKEAAQKGKGSRQNTLFDEIEPEWVDVDTSRIRVENCRDFGGPWLGLELVRRLGLDRFLEETIPAGREQIEWPLMALVLVLSRLCDPSSELHIAEHSYEQTALQDLLGIPVEKVNEQRLYRALDKLLPHKEALEVFLKDRLGNLFSLKYDILLYDITSTYFEGAAQRNSLAARGYSRDKRGDCKQVCIALIVTKEGFPVGYEVFAGNRNDVTTVEEIVEKVERMYGKANRIWVMDRGMVSGENVEFLKETGSRYILGTPKSELKKFERALLSKEWSEIREGLEVKKCPGPDGKETFIVCRSKERGDKERAIRDRFEKRIDEGLEKIKASCEKRRNKTGVIERRIGRLLERNSRAAGLYEITVSERSGVAAQVRWRKKEMWRDWAELSEGCYLLRTNINDWEAEELWRAYMQLSQAEAAFRIQKSDLRIRPIWHQKEERVLAHILVCFLAYVLWKTLGEICRTSGLGNEPRRVFEELSKVKVVDVVLPTRSGVDIRKRCVTRPTEAQAILLQRLGLKLPSRLRISEM